MLCEIGTSYGFAALWMFFTASGLLSMVLLSGSLFYPYYMNPTYERWIYKSNPHFPSPLLVKKEIIQMCKGLVVATFCPAFTLFLSKWNYSNGYCSDTRSDAWPLWQQAIVIFVFSDFFEYAYHWIGHRFSFFWEVHRHHHKFYNPSPFAVIADEYLDQFVRTWPMIIIPLMIPTNMDLLFTIYTTLFYGYGVYLHWGYESSYLSTHNLIFNTSYHHYIHHAISVKNRPIFTGFFFKIWDQLFNSGNPNQCTCVECRPCRTLEEWNKEVKYDYSCLCSPKWWLTSNTAKMGEKYE
jgi:lathosterol oxidase